MTLNGFFRMLTAFNLKIIEDACQAIGAEYKGIKAGALGDFGCFSLYATKNIMCGEGGIVTTNSDEASAAIRSFRQHGMVAPYEYADLGYNYRMSDLHEQLRLSSLERLIGLQHSVNVMLVC